MSYDGIEEKDLPLKLRMMRILWSQGWFVRPNVKLHMYYEGVKTSYTFTDIDVIGVYLQPLSKPLIAVCSAKSGKESDSTQIFWLAGVRSYFGADAAYYIRSNADLRKARPLCDKLNIMAMNEDQLRSIESRLFPRDQAPAYMFTKEAYVKVNQYFEELKKARKELHGYITERYWIDADNQQLMRTITAIREISKLPISKECALFLKYYVASLFTLSLVRLTLEFVNLPPSTFSNELDTILKGGELERSEKEKTIRDTKSLLKEILRHTNLSDDMLYKGIDLDKMFKLDYFDHMVDLLARLVEHFSKAVYLPRMMDALAFEMLQTQDATFAIENILFPFHNEEDKLLTQKLLKNVAVFLQKIGTFAENEIPR